MIEQGIPAAGPPPGKRHPAVMFGAALVVLLVAVGAVAAFAWYQTNRFGDRMASAEAMPLDTMVYVDVDFGSLGDLDRLISAFDAVSDDAGVEPGLDGIIELIDEELMSEFGVTVDDVTPWVGRDVGIGFSNIDLDPSIVEFGAPTSSLVPDVLAAVSVRDRAGADEFIDEMVGILAGRDFVTFTETEYQGVRILSSEGDVAGEQLVVARSGDLVLLGNSESAVRSGIDAQAGESLADDARMAEALDALPGDRAMTVYVNGRLFDDLFRDLEDLIGAAGLGPQFPGAGLNTLEWVAMSAALTGDGVQLDFVAVSKEGAEPGFEEFAAGGGDRELAGLFPEETFIYFGVVGAENPAGEQFGLEDVLGQAGFSSEDLAQFGLALDEIEAELGFDLEDDFLGLLGNEFAAGAFAADDPIFGLPGGPFIGFSALLGVTDPAAMSDTVDKIAAFAMDQGLPIDSRPVEAGTMYGFSDGATDFVVFGVSGEYLVAASDADAADLTERTRSLADNELFQRAGSALPQSGDPLFFVDLRKALSALDAPPDINRSLAPIEGMAANATTDGRITHFTLLTLIEY